MALEIREIVAQLGHSTWLAPDDLTGQGSWTEQIVGAISECRAMIVLLSEQALGSTHVAREVGLAVSRGRAVVPIRVEDVPLRGSLEYMLSLIQRIDAFPPPMSAHLEAIRRRLAALLATEPVAAPEASAANAGLSEALAATALLDPIIGRERDIAILEDRLRSARLVTITGLGGMGKTRVALEIVMRRAASGGWVRLIDLSGASRRGLAVAQLAVAFGVRETATIDSEGGVVAFLRDQLDPWLVLDNLEQLDGAAGLVGTLLTSVPSLRILATSRIRLDVPGGVEHALKPLPVPADDSAGALAGSPSVELFMARARSIGRGDLADREVTAIAPLCRRLDGFPLAIEIAAARTRILPPTEILRRLEASDPILRSEPAAGRRSMDAVIGWSVGLLSASERSLLQALSVWVGGFDLDTAAALCPGVNAIDAVTSLVENGLAQSDTKADVARFRLFVPVSDQIRAGLAQSDLDRLRAAHAQRMLAFAGEMSGKLAGDTVAVGRRFDDEYDNLLAALDWCEVADPRLGLVMASNMRRYWRLRGRFRGATDRLRRLLARNPEPTVERAAGLAALGGMEADFAGPIAARATAESAAALARQCGRPDIELEALVTIVLSQSEARDLERLRESADRIQALTAQIHDPEPLLRGHIAAGIAALGLGDRSAIEHFRRGIELATSLGDASARATMLGNLALVHLLWNEPSAAFEAAAAAIGMYRDTAGDPHLPWVLGLAAVASANGETPEAAVELLAEGVDRAIDANVPVITADTLESAVPVVGRLDLFDLAARLHGGATAALDGAALDESWITITAPTLDRARERLGAQTIDAEIATGRRAVALDMLVELKATLAGLLHD
jgi:non-specific serine/threonine protein kinase